MLFIQDGDQHPITIWPLVPDSYSIYREERIFYTKFNLYELQNDAQRHIKCKAQCSSSAANRVASSLRVFFPRFFFYFPFYLFTQFYFSIGKLELEYVRRAQCAHVALAPVYRWRMTNDSLMSRWTWRVHTRTHIPHTHTHGCSRTISNESEKERTSPYRTINRPMSGSNCLCRRQAIVCIG